MQYLATDVTDPLSTFIDNIDAGPRLLRYGLIACGLTIIVLMVVIWILRKKVIKTKDRDYVELP